MNGPGVARGPGIAKGPGILKGIGVAIVASCVAGFLAIALPVLFISASSAAVIVSGLSLGYLVFLLKHGQSRHGRVVVISCWFLLCLGGWLIDASLVTQILLQLALIWVVRSLYFHASVWAALLDLLLIIMAFAAGIWAIGQTGSLMMAVWLFFLCQSLFGAIPEFSRRNKTVESSSPAATDRFQSAHRIAQEAVRKLSIT